MKSAHIMTFSPEILERSKPIADDIINIIESNCLPSSLFSVFPAPNFRGLRVRLDNTFLWKVAAAVMLMMNKHDTETTNHMICTAEIMAAVTPNRMHPRISALNYVSALLHDTGKLAIAPSLLNKKNHLTEEDWNNIKPHPEIGAAVLMNLLEYFTTTSEMHQRHRKDIIDVAYVALCHHVRKDGSGYPKTIPHEDVPQIGWLCAACDAAHAMHARCAHRNPYSVIKTIKELRKDMQSNKLPHDPTQRVIEALQNGAPTRIFYLSRHAQTLCGPRSIPT